MNKEQKCLICNSKNTKTYPTKISDFLISRMLQSKDNIDTNLIHCSECGFAYYDYRPSNDEITRLYKDYRDDKYQKVRQSYEPWYTKEINSLIGNNPTECKNRAKNLSYIINKYVDLNNIHNVLDFAGDKGQHIPDIFADKNKYVYDISGVVPLSNTVSLQNFEKINSFDFIMCCHLLEHVSNPDEVISELADLLSENGYLYIEVPFDSPFYLSKFEALQFLFNPHFKLSTLVNEYFKRKHDNIMKPMHEHINFFTAQSIEALLTKHSFEMIYSNTKRIDCKWCKIKIISVLVKAK